MFVYQHKVIRILTSLFHDFDLIYISKVYYLGIVREP